MFDNGLAVIVHGSEALVVVLLCTVTRQMRDDLSGTFEATTATGEM